jgi:hypothetical protein
VLEARRSECRGGVPAIFRRFAELVTHVGKRFVRSAKAVAGERAFPLNRGRVGMADSLPDWLAVMCNGMKATSKSADRFCCLQAALVSVDDLSLGRLPVEPSP